MEMFHVEPEMATLFHSMSNEDLCSLAELQEDPGNDVPIELYIFTYFLLFTRTFSANYLERAIQRTQRWVAVTGLDHPDRARRFQILDRMLAWMNKFTYVYKEILPALMDEGSPTFSQAAISNDVDTQIIHQRQEVDRLIRNYERTGIIEDLNKAFAIMEQILDMTPQGSVHRASMLSNFGVILGKRFERTGSMDDLNRAVDAADRAANATPQDHSD
ncbi:hypothetical protein K458DRAFT_212328, partial [Lentithecium fluviatile CBS 122367]